MAKAERATVGLLLGAWEGTPQSGQCGGKHVLFDSFFKLDVREASASCMSEMFSGVCETFQLSYSAQNLKKRGDERKSEFHWSQIMLEPTVYS